MPDTHGGRGSQGEGERQRAGGRGSQGEGERQRAGGRGSQGEGERQPVGVDGAGIAAWMAGKVDEIEPPLRFARIAGGMSNMTYHMWDAAERHWVLRRPPLHGIEQSAHDMEREHRIMDALEPSAVPVPPVVGFCEDTSVSGAPFFVMEHVAGSVLRDPEMVARETDEQVRTRASESLIDTLVALHAVDADAVGLGDLGRRTDYCARQLKRWQRQWDRVHTRDVPEIREAHDRLSSDIPPQVDSGIVHGDYRLDNLILHGDGTVAAVVDWELCTLGDPLADLGMLWVYWKDDGDDFSPLPHAASDQPGFLRKADLAERYAQAAGRDLSDFGYYVALSYWRLAVILEGVYARFTSGAYGDVPSQVSGFEETVPALARAALVAAERSGR